MSKITCVGCGMMGGNIADAFLDHGHEVTIVDVNPAAAQPRIERGARFSASLDEALDCAFVLFSLPNDRVVRSVLEGCSPAALRGKTLVNTTSEVPSDVLALERDVLAAGGRYIDATILTYQGEVGQDDACLLYSGDRRAFEEIEDDLRALSPNPLFLGEGVSVAAEIVDLVVIGVHYGFVYSPLEGIASCAESGVDVDEYLACLRDLLAELAECGVPTLGSETSAAASKQECLESLLSLMRRWNIFDHLSSAWLGDANRSVAAHCRKLLGIAESGFSY